MGPSFWGNAPEHGRADDVYTSYLDFLRARNGVDFEARDARMADRFDRITVRAGVDIDRERFDRNYARFRERDVSREELALLAFVKINAGEAYGVERVAAARAGGDGLADRVKDVLSREELYHTRLLVGATGHFDGLAVGAAWRPTWPLRLLIDGLVHSPDALFHPILLGAEVSGVYVFHWLLLRLGELFPNDPQVRESMEERLEEILVDEIGHVAYNRVQVGAAGRAVAGRVARLVTEAHRVSSPELRLLGLDDATIAGVERFDYADLPKSIRDRAFFA